MSVALPWVSLMSFPKRGKVGRSRVPVENPSAHPGMRSITPGGGRRVCQDQNRTSTSTWPPGKVSSFSQALWSSSPPLKIFEEVSEKQ